MVKVGHRLFPARRNSITLGAWKTRYRFFYQLFSVDLKIIRQSSLQVDIFLKTGVMFDEKCYKALMRWQIRPLWILVYWATRSKPQALIWRNSNSVAYFNERACKLGFQLFLNMWSKTFTTSTLGVNRYFTVYFRFENVTSSLKILILLINFNKNKKHIFLFAEIS